MSNALNQINCYLENYTNTMKHVLYRTSYIVILEIDLICVFLYIVNKANTLLLHYTVINTYIVISITQKYIKAVFTFSFYSKYHIFFILTHYASNIFFFVPLQIFHAVI